MTLPKNCVPVVGSVMGIRFPLVSRKLEKSPLRSSDLGLVMKPAVRPGVWFRASVFMKNVRLRPL